jgi:AmiR/NasT family two-component response regulator
VGPGSVPSAPSAGSGTCARHSLQERAVRQSGLTPNKLQTALNSRILVEQAKGVLLASAGIDVGQAFKLMRDYSRRNNQPVKTVAQSVVNRVLTVDQLRRL